MDIKPIYSALMRNKSGLALIVLQVAITLAVVCNSLFIILQRAERVGRPSGMDEMNTFVISSLGFAPNYDLSGALRQDLDENREMYNRKIENKAILNSGLKTPSGAEELIALLNRYSRKET